MESSAEDGGSPSSSRKEKDKEGFSLTHFPNFTVYLKMKKPQQDSCPEVISGHTIILSASRLMVEERRS